MTRGRQTDEPWLTHFMQRHRKDDPAESVPVLAAFQQWPDKIVSEVEAVLDAVAAAPPPAFSGGGKWEAMRGLMAGYYEIRVRGNPAGQLYRVFCLLERDAHDLGGSSIVVLNGLSKRPGQKLRPVDYRRIRSLGNEFKKRRRVFR